jgi:signal peptidase II
MSKNLKIATLILLVAVFFIFDRSLKWLFTHVWRRAEFSVIGDWLRLKPSFNQGIAFSLPANYWLIIIFTILIIIVLVYLSYSAYCKGKFWELTAYTFVIIGAFSNLLDRFQVGAVIDYFDVRYFTVFNLADVYITGGLVVIVIVNLLSETLKIRD